MNVVIGLCSSFFCEIPKTVAPVILQEQIDHCMTSFKFIKSGLLHMQ